jgi:hypothetical protein
MILITCELESFRHDGDELLHPESDERSPQSSKSRRIHNKVGFLQQVFHQYADLYFLDSLVPNIHISIYIN